jgi:hypothetical protein
MTFRCQVSQTNTGQWSVRHSGPDTGTIEITAGSRDLAIEKLRSELRYRLELCPCTGEQYKDIEIEIVEGK